MSINRQYESDIQIGTIFGIFTGLAIVIACLGLLGLSILLSRIARKKSVSKSVRRVCLHYPWFILA